MSLLSSLGLDDVSADPNDIPVGKYDGVVLKADLVLVESKGELSHVITYQVTEGEFKGAQKQQWYTLYKDVKDADGNFPSDPKMVAAGTPALTDNQKRYYKKLFVDLLGIPEEDVSKTEPTALAGVPITFGIKLKDGYKNVSFSERRVVEGAVPTETVINPF
jgi:hypothetical protein